jgi:drug/metabolite transporter (DMT)-like permease
VGELLAFSSTIFFSLQIMLVRWGLSNDDQNKAAVEEVQLTMITLQVVILLVGVTVADRISAFSLAAEFANLNMAAYFLLIAEGFLGPLGGFFFLTSAVGQIGASRATSLRASNSLFTALFAIIFLREAPGLWGFLGILVITLGIVLVNYKSDKESIAMLPHTKIKGGILALLAGLAFALSQITRGAALNQGATPTSAMLVGHFAALVFILLYYINKGKGLKTLKKSFNLRSSIAYGFAALATVLARYVLVFSFLYIPVWLAVAIRNTQPLVVLLFSWLLFKKTEAVNWRLTVGTLLIIGGVWVLVVL